MEQTSHTDPRNCLPLAYYDATDPDERQAILRELVKVVDTFDLAWYIWTEAKDPDLKQQAFEKTCSFAQTPTQWSGVWVSASRGSKEELFVLGKIEELKATETSPFPQDFHLVSLSSLSALKGCPGW